MDKAAVVIIGAGIQGLSAAYHLARAQVKPIIVVEKELIGSGSSGKSASMLMLQRETDAKITLSLYSYERYMQFLNEIGIDPRFNKIGFLSVVPESRRESSLKMAERRQHMGVKTEILSASQINELVPVVNTDDISFGVFGPDDGTIDARAIMRGFAEAATRMGVTIRQHVRAVGLEVVDGRVTAVKTTSGHIKTETVVNAAGADANEVAAWIGEAVPIHNRLRHIYVTAPTDLVPQETPMVEDAEVEWYYRKEGEGVLMGMGKVEGQEASSALDEAFLHEVRAFAEHRVPGLQKLSIVNGWSGIRSLTPDLSPIVGRSLTVQNFVYSCGWGGEGVMHAPAGGQMVADIVLEENSPTLDHLLFSPARFLGQP